MTKTSIAPVSFGAGISVILSVGLGLVYITLLHEPGPAFYPFAGLIFVVGPIVGGIVTACRMQEKRLTGFLISTATVFAVVFILFLLTYMVLPIFARTSVQLPALCDGFDGSRDLPAGLKYSLPGLGDGILITSDAQSAVVAMIDPDHPPFPSTAYLVNKRDNSIILAMHFDNDSISAAIVEGTLYIYNDKLGFFIDARTGRREQHVFLIDNYGGLSMTDRPFMMGASDGHCYMETTAVISSWNVDGTVVSHRRVTFNSIASGCFISGDTREVTKLSP